MRYTIEQNDELTQVEIRPLGSGRYHVTVGDSDPRVVIAATEGQLTHLILGKESYSVLAGQTGTETRLHTRGSGFTVQVLDSAAARRRKGKDYRKMENPFCIRVTKS